MSFRGFIRDLLGLYVGARLLFSFVFPVSASDILLLGFLIFGFSSWFTLERFGFIKK